MTGGVRLAALAAMLALPLATPPQPARAGCLIFCPKNDEVPAARAAQTFARVLGQPLPKGVIVLGMIDGGFQDRFIQVKLRATDAGAVAVLAALGVAPAAMGPMDGRQTTINPAAWWDIDTRPDLRGTDARLAGFPYAFAARARDPADPARWLVYVLAFQT
jgi:hypothetical protein